MDQRGLSPEQLEQALTGLTRLNVLSRSAAILWPDIQQMALQRAGTTLRVLDIASGAGDLPRALMQLARRTGYSLQVDGCDVNPFMVQYATELSQKECCSFFQFDALSDTLPQDYDVIVCSLFLHHLQEAQAKQLLAKMAQAATLVLINDLRRCPQGYALAWLASRLVTRSPIVHLDGPRSVQNAFTINEVRELAEQAGLTHAQVRAQWPCRFLLRWRAIA